MLKLVKLSNMKYNDNEVLRAEAELLVDVSDEFDEDLLLGLRDDLVDDTDDDSIFVVWDFDKDEKGELVTCEYVLFDNFVDVAEWDYRVVSSVAADELGYRFEI